MLTTGGTGLGPRDRTPEAVRPLLDREVPGYGERLRAEGLAETPMAVLARSFAGTVGAALVVVLPGSPRAVASGLRTLGPTIPHALRLLAGDTAHPAGEPPPRHIVRTSPGPSGEARDPPSRAARGTRFRGYRVVSFRGK